MRAAWSVTALLLATALAAAGEEVDALREQVRILTEKVRVLEERLGAPVYRQLEAEGVDEAIEALLAAGDSSNVSAPGTKWLKISGQIRTQFEKHVNTDFDDRHGDSEDFVKLRTRLAFAAAINDSLEALVKLQDSRLFGEEHSALGEARGVDLKEGWLDVKDIFGQPLAVRAGRQELSYGDQRLLSPLDWSEVTRSFDGLRLMYEGSPVRIHAFAMRVDERKLTGGQDENEDFFGLYAMSKPCDDHEADCYLLYRANRDADDIVGEDGAAGHEDLFTTGARFKGRSGDLDYVAEAAFQFGDHANDRVSAYMAEAEFGATLSGFPLAPRVALGATLASGDDDPDDGRLRTFDPLYTFGHFYLGYADLVGRRNVRSPRLMIRVAPAKGVTIGCDVHLFWLDRVEDGLYGAAGKRTRAGDPAGRAGRRVGWEFDLHVKFPIADRLILWTGLSRFFAGSFLSDTGAADDADFLFIQLTLDF
jgi:hypothetical protein